MATLPRKVAVRLEHTGNAAGDRAQRMAQVVGQAHEQTKGVVTDILVRLAVLERAVGQGRVSFAMPDAATLAPDYVYRGEIVVVTGTLTANRSLSFPDATDGTAYIRQIVNLTTGGFLVGARTVTGGTSANVPNGAIKMVAFSLVGGSLLN